MDKKTSRLSIIKTTCIFTGLIFGAGFASGREHLTFFLRYGRFGVFGIILAGAVIALCGLAVMDLCVRHGIRDYKSFMRAVFGPRLGAVLDVITGLFIFVLFSAMLAGAGALGQQALQLPFSAGSAALAALCFVILLFDIRGIIEINTIVTPILVVGALILGIFAIFGDAAPAAALTLQNPIFWPLSALIYASYNMLTAIAVLAALPTLVTTRKIARTSGILGGFFVALIGLIFAIALLAHLPAIQNAELPMLALAQNLAPLLSYSYTIVLILAIFTTAATNAFALINWLATRTRFTRIQIKIAITILGVIAAHMGFSGIVSYAYT
ncbi:MAG: hypothetical protein LBE35_01620, partial [Clostridiales bacterium]|nr:hypothetical protein [Clostridiales bacterium]